MNILKCTLNKNQGLNSVILDEDTLVSEFTSDPNYSESVDNIVKESEGFQTLYTVSINGIHPEFNEFIVLPSLIEAEKLKNLLAKLSPITSNNPIS